jgi:type III pantothenate kinase
MILCVDIGNTETVMGLFDELEPGRVWRIATDRARTRDETAFLVEGLLAAAGADEPDRIVIASVVPMLNRAWTGACEVIGVPCTFLGGRAPLPIELRVDHPAQVGADRIANTLAAAELYGRDTIVVDLGTATTFDCITADGVFLGGVIAPGPRTGLDHLARATAQLPQVEVEPPERVIGTNTLACLVSGGFYSVVDGIDGIVVRIRDEWGVPDPLVVATGGLAESLAPHCRMVDSVEPALTIIGLAIADRYLRAAGQGSGDG